MNIREIFCGEQDCRLNELRQMTGAIIDLHVVPGTRKPFERVDWTVSHRNSEICDFVLRRLNYWMQETQLICDMAYEDELFTEKFSEKLTRKNLAPPIAMPKFSNRERTRSFSESDDSSYKVTNVPIPATPMTSVFKREPELTMSTASKSRFGANRSNEIEKTESLDLISSLSLEDLIESARWSGALSDTTDHEMNDGRVCFADTVALSKLAECLRHHQFELGSNSDEIDRIVRENSIRLSNREYRRRMSSYDYVFYRVILEGHIQFPVGISKDGKQAKKLAYRQMLDVCLNGSGVQMKPLIGNRVKVIKRPPIDDQHNQTVDHFDANVTYLSTADFSTLSHYKGF